MAVPLLDLKAQYAPLRTEILEAITRVCDSQYFVMAPEVDGSSASSSACSRRSTPSACRRARMPSSLR